MEPGKRNSQHAIVLQRYITGGARGPRHKVPRTWHRIQYELPDRKISEQTDRQYAHNRKIVLGLLIIIVRGMTPISHAAAANMR